MQIAVIGAGPAGLSCALELTRRGKPVRLFEADSSVGGMAKSLQVWGMGVDLGPHRFFSMDRRVAQFWMDR